ncbi:MAG: preprotein translocase subunit SecA [Kiritimatiellia bacterium]
MNLLKVLFGSKNERDVKRLRPLVARINAIEQQLQSLTEEQLKAKTQEFRDRLAKGETLDDLLCEAFAVVKNACRRLVGTQREVCGHMLTWEMVPFDVQLMGGIVLHQGKIAEMQTGEGKTLVATLPMYLNALTGENVQLVTVNDYLALRDATWMGHLYNYLGLTVGCIQNSMSPAERRAQYNCDITYGTNSEFGFDYLRDNGMAMDPSQVVQRSHNFAIVDEVDSILIDEARTPLIISGPARHSSSAQYVELKPLVERLVKEQSELVNKFCSQIRVAVDAGDKDLAQRLLYKVYHGMPKHKQLLHMLEDPAVRKLHEQVENSMLTDMRKVDARNLREELLFTIDERSREVSLTDNGCSVLAPHDPEMFVLPDLATAMAKLDGDASLTAEDKVIRRQQLQTNFSVRSERVHTVDQLLRAYCLYERDVDYVVQDNRVMIVDEFTGRILPGRRWSDGLHQAVEAKEGVEIERETQTLATITIQNYFRLYKKLAGMTGTAETEASEFSEIYKLDVVAIPTNRPVRRIDSNDLIYRTQREKYKAIIDEVRKRHSLGQPVLLGTVTVDTSEVLSRMLRMARLPHNVLNAKNHAREAEIVALAGQPGMITIATNMAGRGTDIKIPADSMWLDQSIIKSDMPLDAKPSGETKTLRKLLEERPCGLHVIGSERHESRRIDRQLRGRCSRQGDPGSSRFYISLEDNLMRLFGSDRIAGLMTRLGMKEGEAIEHGLLNRTVESAQRKVEQQHFSIRKRTLEYDDVMNKQRSVVYELRQDVLMNETAHERILDVFNDMIFSQCEAYLSSPKDAEPEDLFDWFMNNFPIAITLDEVREYVGKPDEAARVFYGKVEEAYNAKCSLEVPEVLPVMERQVFLSCIDRQWQDYLRAMDDLRRSVNLRSYGQRDPLVEYKKEAYTMFGELMTNIKMDIAHMVFRATTSLENYQRIQAHFGGTTNAEEVANDEVDWGAGNADESADSPRGNADEKGEHPGARDSFSAILDRMEQRKQGASDGAPVTGSAPSGGKGTVGRNDPCPCGSGKKYKKCCGRGL